MMSSIVFHDTGCTYLVNERDVLAQRGIRDARPLREILEVLQAVHAHPKRHPHKLVHGTRLAEQCARGRGTALAREVCTAQRDQQVRALLRHGVAERAQDAERASRAAGDAEVDDVRRGGGRDLVHARDGVHRARAVERVGHRVPGGVVQLRAVRRG